MNLSNCRNVIAAGGLSKLVLRAFPGIWIILAAVYSIAQMAPPAEPAKNEADLLELIKLDQTIKLDIRYARADNFVGKAVYTEARAFLQRPAAEALIRVQRRLRKENLGLLIFDGYRPWSVTRLFWEVMPEEKRKFVANPKTGSRHNRGCAVDLSLFDLKTGEPLPMPSDFDEFNERASPTYKGGTDQERSNRDLLRETMEAEGFTVNKDEWWHFDYKDWPDFAIYDISFSEIRNLDLLGDYRVRRVVFIGNKTTRDRTIRKHVYLNEGDFFTKENLDMTIAKINKSKLFEKITEQDVSWFLDKKHRGVDFVFFFTER